MSMWGRVSDPPMPSESSAFLLPQSPCPALTNPARSAIFPAHSRPETGVALDQIPGNKFHQDPDDSRLYRNPSDHDPADPGPRTTLHLLQSGSHRLHRPEPI